MNTDCLEVVSKEFCGDYEDSLYKYKTGLQLIQFFNSNFGYEDTYYNGFPTRWFYTSEKLKDLQRKGLINSFFSLIMSIEFHIGEKEITAVEAVPFIDNLKVHWNMRLRPYKYQIIKVDNEYKLTSFDDDLELIGRGGFAEVYLQKSTGLVLKQLKRDSLGDEGSRHRFKREYEITKELSDIPGIIEVFDFNSSDYFYIMEKCDFTLHDFLTKNRLDLQDKESIIVEILKIVSIVHQRNIIHRDISANNIFLRGNEIRIADFGLGKKFDFVFSHQTKNTAQLGQIQYCPPEQLMELANTGKFSDVYSLGRLINFILTNNPNDKNHKYKFLVEKATSLELSSRYADAQLMYENFIKMKEYAENTEKQEALASLISQGSYDDRVALYISSLASKDLCQNIISMEGFTQALYSYFDENSESILEILTFVAIDMDNIRNRFEDADNFADVANYILENNLSTFEVREKAAYILHHVAYDVNRFYAQGLVDSLIDNGIDPILEEILLPR